MLDYRSQDSRDAGFPFLLTRGERYLNASEVLTLLNTCRQALHRYKKPGYIKARKLRDGYRDHNSDDVYRLLNSGRERKTCLHARVSTAKQEPDLKNQVTMLKDQPMQNGYPVHGIYTDIAPGISFEKRKNFFTLLDELFAYRVKAVIITYKDRLSRMGHKLFHYLFQRFGAEIIVVSQVGSPELDSGEIFEEILAMLHCYPAKMYSHGRNKKKLELSLDEYQNNKNKKDKEPKKLIDYIK